VSNACPPSINLPVNQIIRGVDTPPQANPQSGLPEVSVQPPTAISPTQNAGDTGALGALSSTTAPPAVPNTTDAAFSVGEPTRQPDQITSTGASVPLDPGLTYIGGAPIQTNTTDANLSVGTGTTTKQPDQISPISPVVTPDVTALPAHGPASAAAQTNAPVDPITGLPVAASGNATVAADINQGKSVTPEQIASACAMQRAQVAANCNTCFMSKIIPALAMSGVGAAFAPVIGGFLPGAATATTAATPLNVALSNAITSGVVSQAMGGCGLKSALTAGLGSEASAILPSVLDPISSEVEKITGSDLAGQVVSNALGKGVTSAAIAGLTGGNVGRAALTGAVSGGLTPVATDVASIIDPNASQSVQNLIGSTLGTAAGYGLTGGSVEQGAVAGLESGLARNAKGLFNTLSSGDSSSGNQNLNASTDTPTSPLDTVNPAPASSQDNSQDNTYSGGNPMNAFGIQNGDYKDPGIDNPTVFNPTVGTGGTDLNTTTDENSDTSTDAKTSPLDSVNTGNNDNQDTSTSDDGLQNVVSTGQRINDLNLDPTTGLPVENQTSNLNDSSSSQGASSGSANDGLEEVVSTGQRISPLNLDPVTGLPISPSRGSEATQPQNDLQEITTTASKIPDINVDPVTIPTTSTSQPVSSSPLNDTEITVTGSKTPTATPPEDITPVLPTIDPNDLNFPKPTTVTTDTPKVSVGTAPQTGTGTGSGSGTGSSGLGGLDSLKSIAPLIAVYGQTGDPQILEDIQQMVSQNTPKSDKGESRELEDLVMGKKNYDDETENSARGGLVGYASGGTSSQFGNLFSSVNMFCCTSPQWSPSMRNNVLTYQGTGGKKPNFLLPMHLCTGSAQGHAKGGALPSHYREAAPEGHHPEFITGLTGFYACGGGTGQSDDIPAMLHDGDYVMDAETVSALGDGSSKAGREVLEGFMHKVPHKKVIGGNPVPAKIADGEYVFPAAFVTALGKGDNKAGSKILDGLREKLRAHKRAAPINKIPPKAKSPLDYIKGAKG
jgi:hypothetical protein